MRRLLATFVALCAFLTAFPAAAQLTLLGAGPGVLGGAVALIASINGPTNTLGPAGASFCGSTGTAACLEGWSAQWRTGTPSLNDPDGVSPNTITVSRQGFDGAGAATTYSDTFTITSRVREVYPNQGTLPGSPTYTSAIVSLSDYVYSTDTISGVTNNSTIVSPLPVCNFITPGRSTVGSTLTMEVLCAHRDARSNREVAAVICRATDGTLTVTGSPVAAMTVSGRAGDQNAVDQFTCTVDVSTLATGLITANAKAYPFIGAAASVLDSANQSGRREFSPRYYLHNATLAGAPYYAYVCASAANGCTGTPSSSGVFSTTAATAGATPFDTVVSMFNALNSGAAGKADNVIVYVGSGSYVLTGSGTSRNQNVACITFTRDPLVARASSVVTFGAAGFRPRLLANLTAPLTAGCVRFNDISISRTGTSTIQGEAANRLEIQFDDVTFDNGSNNATWLSNSDDYIYGFAFSNLTGVVLNASTAGEHRIIRGAVGDLNGGNAEGWLLVGSKLTRMGQASRGTRTASGSIIAFNKFLSPGSAGEVISRGADENITGAAVIQNLIEYTSSTSGTCLTFSADAASGNTSHIVIHHNTIASAMSACRSNWFYDEGSTRRYNTLQSCVGDLMGQQNTKGDVFRAVNDAGADGPSATGNLAFLYGVGCRGEFSIYIDASSGGLKSNFAQFYPGLNASLGTSNTVRNDPLFTDYQATTYSGGAGGTYTAGAGGGTYTVSNVSPVKARQSTPVLAHDLAATARPASNDTTGAYVAP